jgi:hypothetical protein
MDQLSQYKRRSGGSTPSLSIFVAVLMLTLFTQINCIKVYSFPYDKWACFQGYRRITWAKNAKVGKVNRPGGTDLLLELPVGLKIYHK